MRNLIIVGDPFHPPETQAPSHVAIMASIGIECDVEDDVEAGCRKLASGKYNLLTFSAARWRMLNAASDPADSEAIPPPPQPDPCWAMSLSGTGRTAILAHLRGGGALLAMHAATIAFDDWPEWGEIVGARWVWGRSGHPPLGRVQTRFTSGSNSPLIVDLAPFDCEDEAYGGMWIAPDVNPLAEARATASGVSGPGSTWTPALWTRQWQGARVVYDALGHAAASLDNPVHRRLVTRAALWALGRSDAEIRNT
jgi:type 1 glutamine amidotransferase